MKLAFVDWMIILLFFAITMIIGIWVARKSNNSSEDFFLGSRKMPWWLLGVSMVATTFSADTPNLVTDIVRGNGVSGNWAWWAFLLTGMLTVFVYARLWRRSGISTDLEFYELRYSGKEAKFLRAFRAIYLGVFFNVLIMATVILAGIKIGSVMLQLSPLQTVLIISIITVIYSAIGGFKGVIYTDFVQFCIAMIGMVMACYYILDLPEIGGLQRLLSHENVQGKISFLPDFNDKNALITLLIIPLAVQWWSVWYPGAEPGGGGYIAQRMLSAKDEKSAIKATLFFNVAHYALRPWPWILIALASLIIFPEVSDIQKMFPYIDSSIVKNDLAFSAMLTYLPVGLTGLVIAALIAALMSTISTHLNWGSSYIVYDFYKRFYNPYAEERTLVNVGRISTVLLMLLSAIFALYLSNALQAFQILLQIGAGTGLIFILRWFWWRVNAMAEIVAMIVSFVVAVFMELYIQNALLDYEKLLIGISITTIAWVVTTLLTKPTDEDVLIRFIQTIKPYRFGWEKIIARGKEKGMLDHGYQPTGVLQNDVLNMFLGCVLVYSLLFGTGFILYADYMFASVAVVVAFISGFIMYKNWTRQMLS
ncbi:MAG: sodium:solute symporter family protein [Saprospiraceae bacterium]